MISIDGRTKVCALLGDPVEHTLSPVIHDILARKTGENLAYVALRTEKEHLSEAVLGASAMHFAGVNVTVPHKSAIIPHLSSIDPLAEKIGAVNVLVPKENGFRGYNTDATGLLRAMEYDGVDIPKERIVILGSGGAARAAAFSLAEKGVTGGFILNRSVESAEKLCDAVNHAYDRCVYSALSLLEYQKMPGDGYLAVQATSVGLAPDSERAPIMERDFYDKCSVGYDVIYKPFQTRFMRFFEEQNKTSYNGLRMLIFQAIESFEKWTGKTVLDDVVPEIIEELKKR